MKRRNRLGSRALMALVFLFLYAPIFLLIVFSFNKGNSNIVWTGFSLDWYKSLFQNRLIMRSVYTTLLVSLLATAIATVAGTFAAIGFYSLRRRSRTALNTVNSIPMMNADIVTGVAMCLFFVAFFTFWGDFSAWFNSVQRVVQLPERLTLGFGNEAEHGAEGYVSGNVFATHITGPVLVKNPAFLDFLTRRLFECRGWDLPEELPPLPHQREAYAVTLSELQKRIGG